MDDDTEWAYYNTDNFAVDDCTNTMDNDPVTKGGNLTMINSHLTSLLDSIALLEKYNLDPQDERELKRIKKNSRHKDKYKILNEEMLEVLEFLLPIVEDWASSGDNSLENKALDLIQNVLTKALVLNVLTKSKEVS